MLKGIEKSDIENILPQLTTYKDLCKLGIAFSDGVIQHSQNVAQELLDFAREMGIPVLEYQPEETFAEACKDFYENIWSQGK